MISSAACANSFIVKSKFNYMHKTAELAECVLSHTGYHAEIMSIPRFDYTDDNGIEVMHNMLEGGVVIFSTYKSRNPWSRVLAYTNSGSNWVYFNRRNNPRSFKSMVNTAIHEASHVRGYSHGDNDPAGKSESVPYKIGRISEKYVEDCELILGYLIPIFYF